MATSALMPQVENGLVQAVKSPLDQNPAAVYLAGLKPTGRRTQQQALDTIAHLLGASDCFALDWATIKDIENRYLAGESMALRDLVAYIKPSRRLSKVTLRKPACQIGVSYQVVETHEREEVHPPRVRGLWLNVAVCRTNSGSSPPS